MYQTIKETGTDVERTETKLSRVAIGTISAAALICGGVMAVQLMAEGDEKKAIDSLFVPTSTVSRLSSEHAIYTDALTSSTDDLSSSSSMLHTAVQIWLYCSATVGTLFGLQQVRNRLFSSSSSTPEEKLSMLAVSSKASPHSKQVTTSTQTSTALYAGNAEAVQDLQESLDDTQQKMAARFTTLQEWLLTMEEYGKIDNEAFHVLNGISLACKQVSLMVKQTGLADMTNAEANKTKLDEKANAVFKKCLKASGRVGTLVTDNDDLPVLIESSRSGEYACVFDPLDSHSNPDASVATGSIFGIYKTNMLNSVNDLVLDDNGEQMDLSEQEVNKMVNYLQPGRNLYAAGYCMYSSSVVFVITLGQGVHSFTLDPNLGEFILTKSDIKCPVRNRVYSFNEGNKLEWTPALQRYIDSLKTPFGGSAEGEGGPYSHRYIGSLVGDFHRTLMFGGIYGYPSTRKHPNGKLRLLYENAPLGFIMEQAGGKATTGKYPVLNITPKSPHQRTQFFAGSEEEIEVLDTFLKEK